METATHAFTDVIKDGRVDIRERVTRDSLVAFGLAMGFTLKDLLMRERG
jgi:hypothetical protein